MRKEILGIAFVGLSLLIAGCGQGNEKSSASVQVVGPGDDEDSGEPDIVVDGKTKEFDVVAKQWEFTPNTITVNEGDTVVLNIENIDVAHGFAISEFNVRERLEPGTTTKVEFIADKKGTFPFFCSVQCGSGHSSMKGELIVN